MQDVTPNPQEAAQPENTAPQTAEVAPVTPAASSEAPQAEVPDDEKLFSTLCYIPVLSILFAPYAVSRHPKSDFVSLHAAQGLGMFGLWFISMVVLSLIPILGGVVWLLLILLSVYGGMNAWAGKSTTLPLVKQLGEKLLNWMKGFLLSTGKTVVSTMNQAVNKVGETMQDVVEKVTPDAEKPAAESQPTTPAPDAPSAETQNK